MQLISTDLAIVGAGPAGAACALSLAESGLRVTVIDKHTFPRDKVCGDALSIDVLNQLPMLSPALEQKFKDLRSRTPSYGVRMYAPNDNYVDIPFYHKGEKKCGYVCSRNEFDNLLVEELRKSNVGLLENSEVKSITASPDGVELTLEDRRIHASVVVGADGANSVVKRFLSTSRIDRRHHSAGLRVYYEGVTGFTEDNFIELFFFKDILPGYLWVFPMEDGKANVGIGVLSSKVSRQHFDLKKVLQEKLQNHPLLSDRFAKARPLETVKGHGLPLGSKKRALSGHRFLLLGDAAGLIDPFTGEGIGNAIRSGRLAATHLVESFERTDFSASFNRKYDQEIYRRMWPELKMSRRLQRLAAYPWLFNFIVKKANAHPHWQQFLVSALSDVNQKKQFVNPMFYYRLVFGG